MIRNGRAGRYLSSVSHGHDLTGERIWLGYFDSEVEAAELLGTFARLNFPQEWLRERRAQVYT